MEVDKITDKIINIICNKLNLSDENIIKKNENMPLTGQIFQFTALDLIYLFFEVEKEFDLSIDMNHINLYGFNTIRSISEVCYRELRNSNRKEDEII